MSRDDHDSRISILQSVVAAARGEVIVHIGQCVGVARRTGGVDYEPMDAG